MKTLKKIICLFKGHRYNEDQLKLYNTRFCSRCLEVEHQKRESPFVVARGLKL